MLDFVDKLEPDPNSTETTDGNEDTDTSQASDDQATQSGGDRGTGTKTGSISVQKGKQTTAFKRRR